MRNYFLNNILFDNEFKKCFHYSHYLKDGIAGSILIEIMNAMEQTANDLTTPKVLISRLNQLAFDNPHEDNRTFLIKHESTFTFDIDAFLPLLVKNISTLTPRKSWNLYSTCYSLVVDALHSLEKKMPRYQALLLEFEMFFESLTKISSAFTDISEEGQYQLMGESYHYSSMVMSCLSSYFLNKDNYREFLNERFIDYISKFEKTLQYMRENINPLVPKPKTKLRVSSSAPDKKSQTFFPSLTTPVIEHSTHFLPPSNPIQRGPSDSPSAFVQQNIFAENFNKECQKNAMMQMEAEQVRLSKHENRHKEKKDELVLLEHQEEQTSYPHNAPHLQIRIKNNPQSITKITVIPLVSDINLYISLDMHLEPRAEFDRFMSVASNLKILKHDSLGSNGIKIYGSLLLSVKCKQSKGNRLIFLSHKIQNTNHYIYLPHAIITHDKYEYLLNNKKELIELRGKARNEIEITQILFPSIVPKVCLKLP